MHTGSIQHSRVVFSICRNFAKYSAIFIPLITCTFLRNIHNEILTPFFLVASPYLYSTPIHFISFSFLPTSSLPYSPFPSSHYQIHSDPWERSTKLS